MSNKHLKSLQGLSALIEDLDMARSDMWTKGPIGEETKADLRLRLLDLKPRLEEFINALAEYKE